MPKQYQINTVQDMINCTNKENLERFLSDLKIVIETAHHLQSLLNSIADAEDIKRDVVKIESDGYQWIDDGTRDLSIELTQ